MTIYRCSSSGIQEPLGICADSFADARKQVIQHLSRQADAQVQWLLPRIRQLLDETEPLLVAPSPEFAHQLSELECQLRQLLYRNSVTISAERDA